MAFKSGLRHLTNSYSSLGHLKHTRPTTDTASSTQILCETTEEQKHGVEIWNLCGGAI